jgi:hypothetical protein
MRAIITIVALVLVLGTAVQVAAQMESGTVVRIDPQSNIVVLDDGRMYRVTPSTTLVVENRPAQLVTLRPGQRVTIQSGEVVTYRDGQYIAVGPGTAVTSAPPVVAQAAPGGVTTVPLGVRQTVYGRVDDVDNDGKVKIKTQSGSFDIRVGSDATRQIRKGDNVAIEVVISPPGAPSASPRLR